jgi:large subunit ribosomal protein L21e
MAQRVGGIRRKTRRLMKKASGTHGRISLKRYFESYKQGEKVQLVQDPSVHKGFFHKRFYGKMGVVEGKRGACYEVTVLDGKMSKLLIVHPIHMRKVL